MKKIFAFMAVLLMATLHAEAQTLFTQYRIVTDAFGEIATKTRKSIECCARIDLDTDAQTITISTKTHGTLTVKFSDVMGGEEDGDDVMAMYDESGKCVGQMRFTGGECPKLLALTIPRKDKSCVHYVTDYWMDRYNY